jgi:hypothetical protein
MRVCGVLSSNDKKKQEMEKEDVPKEPELKKEKLYWGIQLILAHHEREDGRGGKKPPQNEKSAQKNHKSVPTASTTYSTCCGLTKRPLDSELETSDVEGEALLILLALSTYN